jgi:hypothetical protein
MFLPFFHAYAVHLHVFALHFHAEVTFLYLCQSYRCFCLTVLFHISKSFHHAVIWILRVMDLINFLILPVKMTVSRNWAQE